MRTKENKIKTLIKLLVKEEYKKLNESMIGEHPFLGGFISPFTDILKVAKAELTKVTATAFENTKKLAKQAVYFLIPFIGTAAIKKAEEEAEHAIKNKISSINEEHREMYENIWTALKNPDVLGFTFLLDPVLPLTENFALAVKLIKDAPGPLLGALEVLTGGDPKIRELMQRYKKSRSGHTFSKSSSAPGDFMGGAGVYDIGFGEAKGKNIFEQQKQNDPYKILAKQLQTILQDPSVKASINNSPIVKEFRKAGIDAVINTIKPIMNVSSYEELKNVIPNFSQMENEINKKIPEKQASSEEIENYKKDFVEEFKKLYKQMFITNILKKFPGDNKFIKQLLKTIEQL